MPHQPLRVGICAGEASGDILGAGLIKALKQTHPDAIFVGIAGPRMQAQGCQSLFDMEALSVMGLFEVLSRLPRLLSIRRQLVRTMLENPPDVFIGIDAPDFNLGVEKRLKAKGIKTVHYVSPTVWAWRENRITAIARATNLVLSLFPFEKAFYDKHRVPCDFVGHTLADQIPMVPDQAHARQQLSVDPEAQVLAVLPGSRQGEVARLLPGFIDTVKLMLVQKPELVVLIPVVNEARQQQVEAHLAPLQLPDNVRVVIGHSREVMTASDAVLLASGTATLEAMLCKRPMVAAYRFSPMSLFVIRRMYKAKFFSLPNLLAGEAIIPELLQEQATPERMATLLLGQLDRQQDGLLERYTAIHRQLKQDADVSAAKAVLRLVNASE